MTTVRFGTAVTLSCGERRRRVSPELSNRAKETVMAGLVNRIKNFMRSPRGQQMTNKAQEMAKDPRNRERVRRATEKLRRKR
jgi:hypothetical protein